MSGSFESSAGMGGGNGLAGNCWCGMEMKLFTSKTQENPGRPFYRCVRKHCDDKSGKNHAFRWIEEVVIDELVTGKFEFGEMKKEIERLKDVVESSEEKRKNVEFIGKIGFCVLSMLFVYLVVKQ